MSRTIVIYSINDVYELDHLGKLKVFIEQHKAGIELKRGKKIDQSFTTLNGDFLGPSALSLFDQGQHMVRSMNALGVDFVVLGNHEFDYPMPVVNIDMKLDSIC
jgi:2',3'-cyclic-nucleotide 2'-phosphodiesterase (5'-nucleotidase family)